MQTQDNTKNSAKSKVKSATSALLLGSLLFSPATFAAGDDRMGVQTHYAHKGWEPLTTLDAIQELGVGWIRDDLYWSSVETVRGQYQIPEKTWQWIKAAKQHDLKIVLTVTGGNSLYKDPYDKQGYVNFVTYVAKQLKGYVQTIEIINEPNGGFRKAADKTLEVASSGNGWDASKNQIQPWVRKYLDILNASAEAIHKVAPGAYRVIGLGCAPSLNKLMLKAGVSPSVDGIVIHPYSKKREPEWLPYSNNQLFKLRNGEIAGDTTASTVSISNDLRQTSITRGKPRELWLTEQGYTTFQCENDCKSPYASSSERSQAIYAQRRFIENLAIGVRFSSWYNFYDKGTDPKNPEDNFGLMKRDGSLKPAYYAIQRLTKAMSGLEPKVWAKTELVLTPTAQQAGTKKAPALPSNGSYRLYKFTNNAKGEQSIFLWSTENADKENKARTVALKVRTNDDAVSITKLDLMTGKSEQVTAIKENGALLINNITLPSYPVVLTFKTKQS